MRWEGVRWEGVRWEGVRWECVKWKCVHGWECVDALKSVNDGRVWGEVSLCVWCTRYIGESVSWLSNVL